MKAKVVYGWHGHSGYLLYGDGRRPRVGVTLEYRSEYGHTRPILCTTGMHAAFQPDRAYQIRYLDYVRVDGVSGQCGWKFVGTHRTPLWRLDLRGARTSLAQKRLRYAHAAARWRGRCTRLEFVRLLVKAGWRPHKADKRGQKLYRDAMAKPKTRRRK